MYIRLKIVYEYEMISYILGEAPAPLPLSVDYRSYRSDRHLNRQHALHIAQFYMLPINKISPESAESTIKF